MIALHVTVEPRGDSKHPLVLEHMEIFRLHDITQDVSMYRVETAAPGAQRAEFTHRPRDGAMVLLVRALHALGHRHSVP